jgi:glycosyltransferase involved in cell wall biosynthesis
LFVDHTAAMGGGEIALLNLVVRLDRARYVPEVLLFADGPLRARLETAGIETHLLPLDASIADVRKDSLGGGTILKLKSAARALGFIGRVSAFIRNGEFDLVHANSLKSDVLAGLAARWAGTPVLWHVRDRIASDYLPGKAAKVFRVLSRWIPNYVIANSAATLETIRPGMTQPAATEPGETGVGADDAGGSALAKAASKHRVRETVVHDGCELAADVSGEAAGFADPEPISAGANDEALSGDGNVSTGGAARAKDAGEPTPFIGLVGRITRWKGQHIFLQAAALVRRRFPTARFQIIGAPLFSEHDYEQEIRALSASLGVDDVVEFMGFRRDVPELMRRLTILVHASTTGEPFGQVVIEGMSAGKPVVATRGGGIPEIVVDGGTGLLVPMSDAPAMAEAISKLLSDPELARRLGQNGRERVREHFTIEKTARGVERFYDEIFRI